MSVVLIQDAIVKTLAHICVTSNAITSGATLLGSAMEASTTDRWIQAAGRVIQSVNTARLTAWIIAYSPICVEYGLSSTLFPIIGVGVMCISTLGFLSEEDTVINYFNCELKVTNIACGILSVVMGIYLGLSPVFLATNIVVVLSSAYLMQRELSSAPERV